MRKYDDLYQEFLGIAEGSGLSNEDLMVLNNYTDMRDFGGVGGCSTLSYRKHGEIICGQSWDMHASAEPYVLCLHDKESHTYILSCVGCLGMSGINRDGVCVTINNMHCYETSMGIMWPALVRKMLQERSASAAYQALSQHMPCSGHNYLICDPLETIDVECTGRQFDMIYQSFDDDVFFHTNHYLGDLKKHENMERQSKTTHNRYETLNQYFESNKAVALDYDRITHDVFDGHVCKSVCMKSETEHGASTCGGIVVDLKKRRGEIFAGFYNSGTRIKFEF